MDLTHLGILCTKSHERPPVEVSFHFLDRMKFVKIISCSHFSFSYIICYVLQRHSSTVEPVVLYPFRGITHDFCMQSTYFFYFIIRFPAYFLWVSEWVINNCAFLIYFGSCSPLFVEIICIQTHKIQHQIRLDLKWQMKYYNGIISLCIDIALKFTFDCE